VTNELGLDNFSPRPPKQATLQTYATLPLLNLQISIAKVAGRRKDAISLHKSFAPPKAAKTTRRKR
jgi:hypothetical protein